MFLPVGAHSIGTYIPTGRCDVHLDILHNSRSCENAVRCVIIYEPGYLLSQIR